MHCFHFFTGDDFTAWRYRLCDSLYSLDRPGYTQHVIMHPSRKLQARLERMGITYNVILRHSRKPAFLRRRALARWLRHLQGDAALIYGAQSARAFAGPLKPLQLHGICLLSQGEQRPRLPAAITPLHYSLTNSTVNTIRPPIWAQTAGEPVERQEMATPPRRPVLGIYERMQSTKPVLPILDALSALPRHYLWVGGEGPGIAGLHGYSRQQGLEARVRFCGETIERDTFLKSIDALLVPPGDVGNAPIIPQAWAHGTPVISAASRDDDPIVDGESGMRLNANTAAAWQETIQRITGNDASLAKRLTKGGLTAYNAHFRPTHFAETLVQNFFAQNITQ